MYNKYELLYIIDYKSYLAISVCMHSFVKRIHPLVKSCVWALSNSCVQTDFVK